MIDPKKLVFPYVINTVWGHTIYKPIRRARWRIPYGIKTLGEFLFMLERRRVEEKREDHPIAVEIYATFTTKKPLDDYQVNEVRKALIAAALSKHPFSRDLFDEYMEWGYEYEYSKFPESTEAVLRVSRDGITFQEFDITRKFIIVLTIEVIE